MKRIRKIEKKFGFIVCCLLISVVSKKQTEAAVTNDQALQIYNAELSGSTLVWGTDTVDTADVDFAPLDLDGDGVLELFVHAGENKHQNGTFYELWSIQDGSLYKDKTIPFYEAPTHYSSSRTFVLSKGTYKGFEFWNHWLYNKGILSPYAEAATEISTGSGRFYDGMRNEISEEDYYILTNALNEGNFDEGSLVFYSNTASNRQKCLGAFSQEPVQGTNILNQGFGQNANVINQDQKQNTGTSFYGIWVYASKTASDCNGVINDLNNYGFSAKMYETTDWSNLNSEHWYVVSAGEYSTEAAAEAALSGVWSIGYTQAYVKYTGSRNAQDSSVTQQKTSAFYGIWVVASKDSADCTRVINDLNNKGFSAKMYVTTDWNNLNKEFWYVVSAGEYSSESAANSMLSSVQNAGYSQAYVKYTGERK